MLPLLLSLHLTPPTLQPPPTPRVQLVGFHSPSVQELLALQLPPPVARRVDPYKDGVRALEVGVGTAASVGGTVGSLMAALVVAALTPQTHSSSWEVDGDKFVAGAEVYLALQFLAVPALVAWSESTVVDAPIAGSLGFAVAVAYGGQVAALTLAIIAGAASGSGGGAILVFGLAEWFGLPWVASLGLHRGDNAIGPDEVGPSVPATSPDLTPPPPPERPRVPPLPPTALNFSFAF